MDLTTVRNRTTICTVLTMVVAGIVLAGCGTRPAAPTARHGQASSGVALVSHANCVPKLTVGLADNGTTHCVQLYGEITVDLRLPDGTAYDREFGLTGSSLRFYPTPGRHSSPVASAISSGTAVISTPRGVCTTSRTCPTPWSVTIVVW